MEDDHGYRNRKKPRATPRSSSPLSPSLPSCRFLRAVLHDGWKAYAVWNFVEVDEDRGREVEKE